MLLSTALRLQPDPAQPEVVAFVGAGGKSSALFRLAHELAASGRRVVTTTTTRIAAAQIAQAPAFVAVQDAQLPLIELAGALAQHNHVMLIGRDTIEPGSLPKRAGVAAELVDALVEHAETLGISAILIEADGSHMLPAKAPAAYEPVLPSATTLLVPIIGLDAIGLPIDNDHLHRPEIMRRLLGLPAKQTARLSPAYAAKLLLHPQGGLKDKPSAARITVLLNKADTPPRRAAGHLIGAHLTARSVTTLVTTLAPTFPEPVLSRHGPVSVVILAAGQSSRMGRPKQLIELMPGVPLVMQAVRTALAGGVQQVIVVTGAHAQAVTQALAGEVAAAQPRVKLVHNPRWADGQSTTMLAGLAAVEAESAAAIFMPVDQPFVPARLLRRLIRAWEQGADLVAPQVEGELRGAPALFDRVWWPALAAVTGDVGGRMLLHRHAAEVAGIVTSTEYLRDIDRPEDLSKTVSIKSTMPL